MLKLIEVNRLLFKFKYLRFVRFIKIVVGRFVILFFFSFKCFRVFRYLKIFFFLFEVRLNFNKLLFKYNLIIEFKC